MKVTIEVDTDDQRSVHILKKLADALEEDIKEEEQSLDELWGHDKLDLPTRVYHSLRGRGNIKTLEELRKMTPDDLYRISDIGVDGIAQIREAIEKFDRNYKELENRIR